MLKVKLNKTDEKVVATLQAEGKELTLQEIADKSGETPKKIFRSLRKLFENEIVSTQGRKYNLIVKDTKAIKAKLAAKGEEAPEA
jgi:DNA-binding Lrp family transcriptional regulator